MGTMLCHASPDQPASSHSLTQLLVPGLEQRAWHLPPLQGVPTSPGETLNPKPQILLAFDLLTQLCGPCTCLYLAPAHAGCLHDALAHTCELKQSIGLIPADLSGSFQSCNLGAACTCRSWHSAGSAQQISAITCQLLLHLLEGILKLPSAYTQP